MGQLFPCLYSCPLERVSYYWHYFSNGIFILCYVTDVLAMMGVGMILKFYERVQGPTDNVENDTKPKESGVYTLSSFTCCVCKI